jgi:archaellum biogenesis ATPase FlaH
MNEVTEQMRTTVRTSLDVIPKNKCGVRINQNKCRTHVIIIDRTSLYVISKKKCQNKWEQLLEQNYVISNKNRCIVITNQNNGRNKLLL